VTRAAGARGPVTYVISLELTASSYGDPVAIDANLSPALVEPPAPMVPPESPWLAFHDFGSIEKFFYF
jgi:hypothetical protein